MTTNFFRASGLTLDGTHNIVCFGNGATYNTNSSNITLVGYNAGNSNGMSTGCTVVGANAAVSTGSNYCTLIGANTSNTYTGTSYSVCLGYGATTAYTGGAFIFGGKYTSGSYMSIRESGPHMHYSGNDLLTGTSLSQTISAIQVLDGVMVARYSASSTVTITLPTATAMIAAMPDPIPGSVFFGKLLNNNYLTRSLKIVSNTTSGTFSYKGITTLTYGQSANYVVKVINLTTPQLIMYN